jgi:hypothetical protein
MPIEMRIKAAEAFWEDENGVDQQIEAIIALARKLNFRPKSVQAQPLEKRARQLAHLDVSEMVATRALIAHHLTNERPMMAAFLDALGIKHEDGLISEEDVPAPPAEKIATAARVIADTFPADRVTLYLNTLLTQDPDTWGALEGLPQLGA